MENNSKSSLHTNRNLSVGLAFVLFALIIGVYFLFKPFPAGPSLAVKANVPEAASVMGWSAYANPPTRSREAASVIGWSAYVNAPVLVKKEASVMGWSIYANAPVEVKEAASVVGWSAYANPPTIVNMDALRYPLHQR